MDERILQGIDDYEYTVRTTWEVSCNMDSNIADRGHERQAASFAVYILHVFPFLHFDGIPGNLFTRAFQNALTEIDMSLRKD